jgi:hypothetical protein
LLWSPRKNAGSSFWALSACWRAATRLCTSVTLALERLRLPAESAFRVWGLLLGRSGAQVARETVR